MALFSMTYENEHRVITIFNLRIRIKNSLFSKIDTEFKNNSDFDCKTFDDKIAKITDNLFKNNKFKRNKINNDRIAVLATVLYDMGGHTECVKNLVKSLCDTYEITTFLTQEVKNTYIKAPEKIQVIEKYSHIDGLNDSNIGDMKSNLTLLFNKINEYSPKALFVYTHMNDSMATALLYMIKKYTDIKIIYFNHGTHCPALGMTFAHTILEEISTTKEITNTKRHLYNCKVVGLQSNKKEEIKYYTEEEKNAKRQELNIPLDALVTISGGSAYKYFENGKSLHFEMIKRLLEQRTNLYHIAIINFSEEQKEIVDKIFQNTDVKNRIRFLSFTPHYEILFQSADLFIDSFPMSSAMTQIDLMSMKVPTVVKINADDIALTFHEYMPKGYEFMYDKIEDMEKGILTLLDNPQKRIEVANSNYEHWLINFENSAVKQRYIDAIND